MSLEYQLRDARICFHIESLSNFGELKEVFVTNVLNTADITPVPD